MTSTWNAPVEVVAILIQIWETWPVARPTLLSVLPQMNGTMIMIMATEAPFVREKLQRVPTVFGILTKYVWTDYDVYPMCAFLKSMTNILSAM